ncbi:MAG: hypothetical protein U0414_41930 [Polyangiaceae bacterium]
MKRMIVCLASVVGLSACAAEVDLLDGSGADGGDGDGASSSTAAPSSGPGAGTPCKFLHGEVTLYDWNGDPSGGSYNDALFSFEFASKDIDVNLNDGDILYSSNMFAVNTVVDDASFIVDLGDVPLTSVPPTIDPSGYPTGNWGEHDDLQAVLDHTYVVRTIDGNTKQWAAFRVLGLAPGESVTIEWIRSSNPDALVLPSQCL